MNGTWSIKGLLGNLKIVGQALLSGELVYHMHINKYFIHILYCFFLAAVIIWASMKTDSALTKVETLKAEIYEQELVIEARRFELSSLENRSKIGEMLREKGSSLSDPTSPAVILE